MKRSILFAVFLCVCACLCACGHETNPSVESSSDSQSELSSEQNKGTPQESTEDIVEPMPDDPRRLSFESLDKYESFIEATALPKNFVSYEKFSQLGKFDDMVFLSDAYNGDYSSSLYTLIDDVAEVALYVDMVPRTDVEMSQDYILNTAFDDDMRHLSADISGCYVHEGLTYRYISGELLSITWQSEGVTYTLCGNSMLGKYPQNSTTVVGKLLNTNTASATINSVFDSVTK